MFNLARQLAAEITRPYHLACRCGQVAKIIQSAANDPMDAAKVFVEAGWRWVEAEGGAMCPNCAAHQLLD